MFARTDRLLLRPGWREDAPALFDAIADPAIVRNLATAPWPYRLSDAEAFLGRERAANEPAFLIFRRTNGAPELIGGVGFGPVDDESVELGYWLARPFWGQGYATEAAGAAIAIARHALPVQRIEAGHFLDNPASGRVLAKLGFRTGGEVVLRHSLARGECVPCRQFMLELGPREVASPQPLAA